jgi:hypothetical protein
MRKNKADQSLNRNLIVTIEKLSFLTGERVSTTG